MNIEDGAIMWQSRRGEEERRGEKEEEEDKEEEGAEVPQEGGEYQDLSLQGGGHDPPGRWCGFALI